MTDRICAGRLLSSRLRHLYPDCMRRVAALSAVLLCAAAPALAQVTIDLHALDALPGAKNAPAPSESPRPRPRPKPQAVAKPPAEAAPAIANGQQPTTATPTPPAAPTPPATPAPQVATVTPTSPPPTAPVPPAATLPTGAPPIVTLPPTAPPTEASAPPPPPPVSASAATNASTLSNGLRLTFGSGETDLNPSSIAAIDGIAQGMHSHENSSVNVVAYAAPTPDDPSTARRLSLSRALAVRSALIADGVNSSRIYVRALGGSETGNGPDDRVDVTLLGANAAAGSAAKPESQVQNR
jgi:outer membrane protein OmpA-like peptidoglycan-associated protein